MLGSEPCLGPEFASVALNRRDVQVPLRQIKCGARPGVQPPEIQSGTDAIHCEDRKRGAPDWRLFFAVVGLAAAGGFFLSGLLPVLLLLGSARKGIGFLFSFILGDSISFLNTAHELVAFSRDDLKVVIGQLAPIFFPKILLSSVSTSLALDPNSL